MKTKSLLPITAFLFLIGIPLAEVLRRAILGGSRLPESFGEHLFAAGGFTAYQSALSTLCAFLVGVPLGIFYSRRWHPAIRGFATASFALPTIVTVGAVGLILRDSTYRYGLPAVVFAHAFLNAPWIALATSDGIRSLPRDWVLAARSLGASPNRVFLRIEAPWVARRIALAVTQVFGLCVMSFAIVLLLGGGPPVTTLETEIYASVRGSGLELSQAALFAGAQILLAGSPLALILWMRARNASVLSFERSREWAHTRSGRAWHFGIAVAFVWFAIPGIALFRGLPAGHAFEKLATVFRDEEWRLAVRTSFRIALSSAAFACGLGVVFIRGSGGATVRVLAAVPAGVSPLVLCLGFFLAYSRWIDPFEGSELAMICVQAALFLPLTLRILLPLLEEGRSGWRKNLVEAARSLGATPTQAWWKLEWPRWAEAFRHLFRLVFVWSFADVAAASFFGSEKLSTVGVTLLRWVGQYRFEDMNAALFWIYLLSAVALISRR